MTTRINRLILLFVKIYLLMTVPSTFSQGSTELWERLSQQDIQHVKELRCLNNPQLVPILRDELCRSFRWIVSIKIRSSILQETAFCRFITEEILLYFCSFEIWKTQINIFYIVPVRAQRCFSSKYGCHDVTERRCKQYFLSGVQKSFSALCKSKQMESSFSGAIYKIDQANHSPKGRLCSFVLALFETSLFEPATEINICMHSKAAESVVGKT